MADMKILSLFCHMMYTMLHSGIDVKTAFQVCRDEKLRGLERVLDDTYHELETGKSLSDAMRKNERTFTPELVNTVYVTEQTGDIEAAFLKMAERLESKAAIRKRLKRAGIYPSFVLFALTGSLFAVTSVSFGIEFAVPVFIILILLFAVFLFLRFGSGRLSFMELLSGNVLIRMPVVGNLIFEGELSDLAANLALFYSCGIQAGQALAYSAQSARSNLIHDRVIAASALVFQGQPLSQALSVQGVFPKRMIDIIKTGEETGKMEDMLKEAESYYRFEVERKTENLMAVFRI